jgi:hypothetical protein
MLNVHVKTRQYSRQNHWTAERCTLYYGCLNAPLQSRSTIYEIVGFRRGEVEVYVSAENVPSTNIIPAIESRKMRRAGQEACMGEWRGACSVYGGVERCM